MKKHYLLTLAAGFLTLATATAQIPEGNFLQKTAQTSGKMHTPLPVNTVIKPQMPVTFSVPEKPAFGQMPQLRAEEQALKLDSVIYFTPEGDKAYRTLYRYNERGQVVEQTYYTASPSGWKPENIVLYEGYNEHGKYSKSSSFSYNGEEKELSFTIEHIRGAIRLV